MGYSTSVGSSRPPGGPSRASRTSCSGKTASGVPCSGGVVEQVHGRADLLAEDADELGVLGGDQRANLQIARGGAVGGDEVVVRRRLRVEPERGGRDHQHLARGLRADEEIGHRRRGRSGEARRARPSERERGVSCVSIDRAPGSDIERAIPSTTRRAFLEERLQMPRARPERHLSVSRLVWHFAPGEGRKKRFGVFDGSLTRRFPSAETPPGNPARVPSRHPIPSARVDHPLPKARAFLRRVRGAAPRAHRPRARRDPPDRSDRFRTSERCVHAPRGSARDATLASRRVFARRNALLVHLRHRPPTRRVSKRARLHPSDVPLPPPPPPPSPQTPDTRPSPRPPPAVTPSSRHVRVRGRAPRRLGGAAPPLPPAVLSKRPAPRAPPPRRPVQHPRARARGGRRGGAPPPGRERPGPPLVRGRLRRALPHPQRRRPHAVRAFARAPR